MNEGTLWRDALGLSLVVHFRTGFAVAGGAFERGVEPGLYVFESLVVVFTDGLLLPFAHHLLYTSSQN